MHTITRLCWLITGVLLVAILIGAVTAAGQAPAEIPAHFDAAGRVTRWTANSLRRWLLLPGMAVVLAAGMGWLSSTMPRRPGWVNLPDKERLLALPPMRQAPVIRRIQALLAAITTQATAILGGVTLLSWRGATGQPTAQLSTVLLVVGLLSTPALLVGFLPWIQAELDRQHAAWRADGERGRR